MSSSVPSPGSKILVTGASGFIGIHTVKSFLDAGFKVVGTVRSASKGEYIVKQFPGQPFEYTIVEDIGAPDAFDEAVKGVEGVAHTASPFHLKADDPQELIRPAVNGTVGVLKSLTKNNPEVKRVVITSSVAAVLEPATPPRTFTEADFNKFSIREVEEKGKAADGGHKYRASKALAEEAAWKYAKEHGITLATINPPLVFGPILHEVASPEALNTSVANFYKVVSGQVTEADLPGGGGNWIDVREVSNAHVLALTKPEAANQRFIISAGPFATQQFTEFLASYAPDLPNIPKGKAGAVAEANDPKNVLVSSGAKAERELGIVYRPIEESAKDMYESLKARGW